MRQRNFLGLLSLLAALICSIDSYAGDTYYKNLSFTVKNPDTAKGRVYLTPYNKSDSTYCTISKDPKIAKVEGNLSTDDSAFRVNMFVIPADGYVLDCLATPKAYVSGDYRSEYMGNIHGYPISSSILIIDEDTTRNCTTTRPKEGENLRPVSTQEFYAIFVQSKKMSVHNPKAGAIESTVKAGKYGIAANDLTVTGPLSKSDIKYLNYLSQNGGLIRLDLSGASFTVVPDSAFFNSGLFELKLPSNIEAIGNHAFAKSIGLKPVKLPDGIVKGQYTIEGCTLMNLLGVKETSQNSDWDYNPFWWLFI